jgi:outer membrane cobalamin receptor
VDHQSLTARTAASPWVQTLWPITRFLTLRAGGGVYRQEPGFTELLGLRGSRSLEAQRAYHTDAGVEGRIGTTARWQMTIYNREDRDLLRLPDSEVRVVDGAFQPASVTTLYRNALDGHARGIEWLVQRQTVNGFSGWASYALAYSEYHDRTTGETFWGDFDQRHTVNLCGNYRVTDRLSLGARYRTGSNFPITGYWAEQEGTFFVGRERNTVRLPRYSRLDVRANRTFTWDRKRLTLFLEGINLLNQPNVRFALPAVNRRTFEATGLLETMAPFIPSVGVLIEF